MRRRRGRGAAGQRPGRALCGVDKKLKEALHEGADQAERSRRDLRRSADRSGTPASVPEPTESTKPAKKPKHQKEQKPPKATPTTTTPTEPTTPTTTTPTTPTTSHNGEAPGRRRGHRRALGRHRPRHCGREATDGGGHPLGALRARRPARLRRDVERLQGDRPGPRADGRGQGARRAPLRRRALRRTLPPRGAGGRQADPPQHRPGLRHRRRRRPPLHRHGVRRGALRRPGPAAAGARSGPRPRPRSGSRPAPGSTTRTGAGSSTATSSRAT